MNNMTVSKDYEITFLSSSVRVYQADGGAWRLDRPPSDLALQDPVLFRLFSSLAETRYPDHPSLLLALYEALQEAVCTHSRVTDALSAFVDSAVDIKSDSDLLDSERDCLFETATTVSALVRRRGEYEKNVLPVLSQVQDRLKSTGG